MARINTVQLIDHATNLGPRALKVQQDPAVQKAANQVVADAKRTCTAAVQTYASAVSLAVEASASWRRHGPGGGATLTSLPA